MVQVVEVPPIVTSPVVELKPLTDSLKVTEQLKLVLLVGVVLGVQVKLETLGAVVSLNVAVIVESTDSVLTVVDEGHGFVVPPQFEELRLPPCELQPAKVEPVSAVAVIRYVSPFLNLKVPLPAQVTSLPEIEHDGVAVSGVSPAILANLTDPLPLPAFV